MMQYIDRDVEVAYNEFRQLSKHKKHIEKLKAYLIATNNQTGTNKCYSY